MKNIPNLITNLLVEIKQTFVDLQGKPMNKLKNQNLLHSTLPKVIGLTTISSLIVLSNYFANQTNQSQLSTLSYEVFFLLLPLIIQMFVLKKFEDLIYKVRFICFFLFLFQNTMNLYAVTRKPEIFNGISLPSYILYLVLNLFIFYAQKNIKINFLNLTIILVAQITMRFNKYLIIFQYLAFLILILERELNLLKIALLLNFQKQILNTLPMGCIIYRKKDRKLLFTNKSIEEKVYSQRRNKQNTPQKRKSSLMMNYVGENKTSSKMKRFLKKLYVQPNLMSVKMSDENMDLWSKLQKLFSLEISKKKQYKYYCLNNQVYGSPETPQLLAKQDFIFFEVLVNTGITYEQQDCLMISIYDVTTEFRSQKYEQMNLFKSQLLKSISHELRTRLNIVQGILEILQNSNLKLTDRTNVNFAYNNCRIQSHIVGSIIDYNLLKEGNMKRNIKKTDLRLIIRDLQKLFFEECQMKDIDINIQFKSLNYEIEIDVERLMHILINIMSNAVKFTDHTGSIDLILQQNRAIQFNEQYNPNILDFMQPKLNEDIQFPVMDDRYSLSIDPVQEFIQGDGNFVIQIKDSGHGINQEKLRLIISMLETDDPISVDGDKAQGFMLGLRSSCKLLKFINDDFSQNWLKIYSESNVEALNSGTLIQIELLPFKIGDNSRAKSRSAMVASRQQINAHISLITDPYDHSQQAIQAESQACLVYQLQVNNVFIKNQKMCSCRNNVMIVDDEPFNLMVLESMLKLQNMLVEKTNNGEQFIQSFKKSIHQCVDQNCRIYKFVIMDYQMPILNGAQATEQALDLCRRMKRKDVIIIGCTAFSDQEDIDQLRQAGMKYVCIKPITKHKIQEIIQFVNSFQND